MYNREGLDHEILWYGQTQASLNYLDGLKNFNFAPGVAEELSQFLKMQNLKGFFCMALVSRGP